MSVIVREGEIPLFSLKVMDGELDISGETLEGEPRKGDLNLMGVLLAFNDAVHGCLTFGGISTAISSVFL